MRDLSDVVICSPLRTPIGDLGGALCELSAADLGANLLTALIQRTGLDPRAVGDVVLGHCYPNAGAPAIGRVVALDAGLPVTVPGMQIDRRCGSGLQAIIQAVLQVASGASDLVIAGGVESMSNVPGAELTRARTTSGGRGYPVPGGMIETAENLRRHYRISRQEQDAWALRSHTRAVAAQDAEVFDAELVPILVQGPSGTQIAVSRDEHPRRDTTMQALGALKPVLRQQDPEATVTAGNASAQSDAAALVVVTTRQLAREHGWTPSARLLSWAVTGTHPARMGLGPVAATARALQMAGLRLSEIDLIELNEAFAVQVLAVMREWQFTETDGERVNIHGSGISLGHPVGATGARMVTTLVHELCRRAPSARRGGQPPVGLVTLCIGGGQGMAAVLAPA